MAQKIYVGNLPFSTTEDDLKSLFGQYGQVNSVSIITDRDSGRPRGFAFVEMEGAEEAIKALDGHELEGRALRVNIARESQPGGAGGRGGGRPPHRGGR